MFGMDWSAFVPKPPPKPTPIGEPDKKCPRCTRARRKGAVTRLQWPKGTGGHEAPEFQCEACGLYWCVKAPHKGAPAEMFRRNSTNDGWEPMKMREVR